MGSTILVVEDESLVGLEIKEDLERLGYEVPEVIESGEEVESAVERYKPDLMLMDIHLCGDMDGIEAALKVKSMSSLPVIFITAYSDDAILKRAAQVAPDGFLLKPFEESELAANVRLALARVEQDGARRRERDLLGESAAALNESFVDSLPSRDAAGPGYRVGAFLEPCASGTGDLLGVFPAGGGKRAFYGLDVMGHGLLASVLALSLRDSLPLIALAPSGEALRPAEVMRALYCRYGREGELRNAFFTIAYGVLDESTGEYSVARAGHTPVLHLKAGGTMSAHNSQGMAVGLSPEAVAEESRGVLEPGDKLLVLSDGLLEAFGGEGLISRDFERVSDFVARIEGRDLDSFVGAFWRRARDAVLGGGRMDDASLLAIERIG